MIDVQTLLGAFGLAPAQIGLVVFAAALTVGLSNVVKKLMPDGSRWVPVAVLCVGVLVMEAVGRVAKPEIDPITSGLIGLMVALMASGMWSWGKTVSNS